MIVLDIRHYRFSMLLQKETLKAPLKVNRERPGEIIVDLPGFSLMLTDHAAFAGG